ncbi:MAG TPA: hypothetical protein DIT04_06890 [Dysgonomonas sp.]|nr:hypothetical protein [Dysgonomonas sp.]
MIGVSAVCKAQTFTATEFINLVYKSQEDIQKELENKGYQFDRTENGDMSENDVFTSGDMTVSVIYPTFEDAQSMVSWEFPNSGDSYNKLAQEISAAGFQKFDTERRTGFTATTYQRPGMTITLSNDKTDNSNGIVTLAVRYTSLSGLAGAMDR